MKFLKYLIIAISFPILTIAQLSKDNGTLIIQGIPSHSYLNLNNISTIYQNNGLSDTDNLDDLWRSGFEFPKGSGKTAMFISGFMWGAFIPGDPQVKIGGSTFRSGLQPGKIISPGIAEDPDGEHVRIYRVRPDVYPGGPPINLTTEAITEGKSESEVRAQYETDWVEWRAIDGAPYDDLDGNGLYNPNIDIPGIPGAVQTIWYVANDLDPSLTFSNFQSPPLGIEYQATYWEYQDGSFLDNVIFRKFKLINKSTTTFEDMYISMWSDPDVGSSIDDFVGCDTSLNLGYAYNAHNFDAVYDPLPPPAVGFKLLQGPSDSTGSHLTMTAFHFLARGGFDPVPIYPIEYYNLMRGRIGLTGELFINPVTGQPTTYANSGDPLTGEGWIDGLLIGPGDRRMGLSSGPFNMAIGDTQEIVIAEIAALGVDNLDSFKRLKYFSAMAQKAFDTGYYQNLAPKPPNPSVTIERTDPQIILNWGTDATSVSTIENFNESGFTFQGYNVYQLMQPLFLEENALRISTFDVVDGITEIHGIIIDPETGLPVVGIQQYGSDSGIERMISLDRDYIKDSHLIVGKKYYFAVTAYSYNPDPEARTNNTESLINIIEVIYYDSLPGASYSDTVLVKRTAGKSDAKIIVTIEDPTKITGDDYEIFFTERAEIRNENGDWVSGSIVNRKFNPNDPDTLTLSTIDIAAVYGPQAGITELRFHLDVIHHNFGRADGVRLKFPGNIDVLSAPQFEASGGTITPEIIPYGDSTIINMGLVNHEYSQNGVFHEGGEDWIVIVTSFEPPKSVYWFVFDDGWPDPSEALDAFGITTVTGIGFESRVAQYWNIFDLTIDMMVLENQSIVNNIFMYPPRDDFPEYFGHVKAPIIDGVQINVDIRYDAPLTIGTLTLDGEPLSSNSSPP